MPLQYKCCSSPSPTSSPSDHATGSCGTKVHSAAGRVMKQASMTACSLLGLKPSNYEPKYADELSWTAKTQNQQIVRGDFSLEVNGGRVIVDSTFTSKYQTTKKAATSIGHSATKTTRLRSAPRTLTGRRIVLFLWVLNRRGLGGTPPSVF